MRSAPHRASRRLASPSSSTSSASSAASTASPTTSPCCGTQLWLFVQGLSQLKAVYPRWQSFLANTSQQFFGTADYDTASYVSDALGQRTIRFETSNRSQHGGWRPKSRSFSSATGEHIQGRSLLTPDEVMRLGPARPIVMIAGEPPWLLDRINYLADPAYAGRFDPNPMHFPAAAQ
jgi:type IV secretion system protein VirD4